jgi:DNA polymerase III subunit delta
MSETTPHELVGRLSRGKPVAAILLLGTDPYLRDLCRNQIIQTCVPGRAREWAVQRFSAAGRGWNDVFDRAEIMPMLSPRQVVIVEDADSIERLGEKSREKILDTLADYLESPAPYTILVFEAGDLDGRQRFYKLLAEKALIVPLTIGDESAALLAVEMARELKIELERDAAELLAEIANREPARIRVELEKLAAYTHGRSRVTTADVRAVVVAARKNEVWDLADMLASRNRAAALEFFENLLREGEQPAAMIGALGWMYRKLIEARELPHNLNGYQAAGRLQMNPKSAEAAIRNAHRIPKNELVAGLVALAETDSQLKSANPDPRALMEFLISRLAPAQQAKAS